MKDENEIKRIQRCISDTEDTIAKLLENKADIDRWIQLQKAHISNYKEILGHLGVCECRYSKALNQPQPRLCVDCGKPEEVVSIRIPVLLPSEKCQHLYSRSMDQPYPRLCLTCHEPEINNND